MPEDKSSNLILFGVIIAFFAYLIYSSKNQQLPQPIQPAIQPSPVIQQFDYSLLYKLQEQTFELSNAIKLQNEQLKLITQKQSTQSEAVSNLESTKCSNVVSMETNNIENTNTSPIRSLKPMKMGNNRRESEEYIASTVFGMK